MLVLIQISFNISSPTPCFYASRQHPHTHLSPSPSCNLSFHPAFIATSRVEHKQAHWRSFLVCVCVCVGVKYSLCSVCVKQCVRRGGEGRQEGEQMGSFSSAVCTLSYFFPHFHGRSILPFLYVVLILPPCSSTHLLPALSLSVVLWQMAAGQRQQQPQSRSQSVSRGWGEEKG